MIPLIEPFFEKQVSVKRVDVFNIDSFSLQRFLNTLPQEAKKDIIKTADAAIEGKILAFSSVLLDYGNPIQWQVNPENGKSANHTEKWYRIPDFDPERGDIKLIWEASRFTHFFFFARAYLLTGNDKYYLAFSQQLKHWLKSNPYSLGANYKCGQECAMRMMGVLMVFSLFQDCGLATQQDATNVFELVSRCYRKILSNFFYAHKCVRNNHTLSELCGMIIGAWCCMDENALHKAYRMFNQELLSQFYEDGGYIQHSFNYTRLALQVVECVCKLSEKIGVPLCASALDRVQKSAELLYQLQSEEGCLPNYGANDGTLLFPVTACSYQDYRPVINTIYALTTGARRYAAGLYDEELLWFAHWPERQIHIDRKPGAFYESGLFIVRHQCGSLMTVLQNFHSRPSHMDQLHIDLWHKGINVLCDSGSYSYASEMGDMLVKTRAHNTAVVGEQEQMNKCSNFLVTEWTRRKEVTFDVDLFKGTMYSPFGRYTHTRQVSRKGNTYHIKDHVSGKSPRVMILFHTPCDVALANNQAVLSFERKQICTISSDSGIFTCQSAKHSLYYKRTDDIRCLMLTANINPSVMSIVLH